MSNLDHFANSEHALFSGGVFGHLSALGVNLRLVMDKDGNHTPFIDLTLPPISGGMPRVMRLQVMPTTYPENPSPQYNQRYDA